MRRKKSRMNVRIYSVWKNPRIFERMNIFIKNYSNIFEDPNIRYTLPCNAFPTKNKELIFLRVGKFVMVLLLFLLFLLHLMTELEPTLK